MVAYIERISEVNPLINAVVDQRFEDAIEESKIIDDLIGRSDETQRGEILRKKPFLGIPVTTKNLVGIKGDNKKNKKKQINSHKHTHRGLLLEILLSFRVCNVFHKFCRDQIPVAVFYGDDGGCDGSISHLNIIEDTSTLNNAIIIQRRQ